VPDVKDQKGLQKIMFLESVDNPNKIISLSIWDSKEDAEAYEQRGPYMEIIQKAMHLLPNQPTSKSYEAKFEYETKA
jgi:heme-degrading monooxygenase HmoA